MYSMSVLCSNSHACLFCLINCYSFYFFRLPVLLVIFVLLILTVHNLFTSTLLFPLVFLLPLLPLLSALLSHSYLLPPGNRHRGGFISLPRSYTDLYEMVRQCIRIYIYKYVYKYMRIYISVNIYLCICTYIRRRIGFKFPSVHLIFKRKIITAISFRTLFTTFFLFVSIYFIFKF